MKEYKQEIIPFSHGHTIGYANNPDRIEVINEHAKEGWRFVSSFLHECWGKDLRYDGFPASTKRLREFMTFEMDTAQ